MATQANRVSPPIAIPGAPPPDDEINLTGVQVSQLHRIVASRVRALTDQGKFNSPYEQCEYQNFLLSRCFMQIKADSSQYAK